MHVTELSPNAKTTHRTRLIMLRIQSSRSPNCATDADKNGLTFKFMNDILPVFKGQTSRTVRSMGAHLDAGKTILFVQ